MATRRGRARGPLTVLAAIAALALVVWFADGFGIRPDDGAETRSGFDRTGINQPQPKREVPQVALGQADADAPNMLVVMTDDMRYDDLRYMPFTQRFFDRAGITFVNSFSPFPWCCPARASFISGQLAQNHGVLTSNGDFGFGVFDDSRTIATALREAGYNNAFVGRYLNGYGKQPSFVTGGNSARYVPAGWDQWRAMPGLNLAGADPLAGGPFQYFDTTLNVDGELRPHPREYQTNLLGTETRGILERYSREAQPWFTVLAPSAPHWGLPYCEKDDPCGILNADGQKQIFLTPARPGFIRGQVDDLTPKAPGIPADGSDPEPDISDQPEWLQEPVRTDEQLEAYTELSRQRGEALLILDRELKRTVDQLRDAGELENTIVAFTSDNGYFMGEHREMPGKIKPQEPSLRVPLLIAGPGIPRGQLRFDPVTTADLTATLADYADATGNFTYPIDGRSLRPLIEQGDQGWTRPVLYSGHIPDMDATAAGLDTVFDTERDGIGVRTPRWSYAWFRDGSEAFYDLDNDPDQLRNLADVPEFAGVKDRLRGLAVDYRDCWGEGCNTPMPGAFQRDPEQLAAATESQLRRTRSYTDAGAWVEVATNRGVRTRLGIEGNPVRPRRR
ncbi:sulfatase-like hydrolase/transferase [Nocardioidaceae bacterium]|nr:sulfatase-like hydrolase/transferase [Nocardioidaceae bacterium]